MKEPTKLNNLPNFTMILQNLDKKQTKFVGEMFAGEMFVGEMFVGDMFVREFS